MPNTFDISIIDPDLDPRWDKFVENHPYGWIVHLSGWKKVLERSFNHMKGHCVILCDPINANILAGLQLFEVRSWLTGNRLVSIPFATLCDPLISSIEQMDTLFNAALKLSRDLGIPRIELRTLKSSSLISNTHLTRDNFFKHHYIPLDAEPEELKKSFHRTNVRQRIQRAQKSNLNVRVADSELDVMTFYKLHISTRKKIGLPPQPCTFFKQLWETFSPSKKMVLLLAEQNSVTLAGLILFKFRDRVSAEFLASDERYLNISPNHLLFWEAIQSAYEEGYAIFDFGRTSPTNESLMNFKKRWGTSIVDLPEFFCPLDSVKAREAEESSSVYKLINKIINNAPEPVCRLLGHICYRHLG